MSPSEKYLALFNEIDKYLDLVINQTDRFMPYNQKLKFIAKGNYSISKFVRLHDHSLKYFGELRNMISHGLRESREVYAEPSAFALEQIKTYRDTITRPSKITDVFSPGTVLIAKIQDHVQATIAMMNKEKKGHIPIFDESVFCGLFDWKTISVLLEQSDYRIDKSLRFSDIAAMLSQENVLFWDKDASIFDAEKIFEEKRLKNDALRVLFITRDGTASSEILAVISASDLPLIMDRILLTE